MPRPRPLAKLPVCPVPEATLRHLISRLEDDADTLSGIADELRPVMKDHARHARLSRLHHLVGTLQGYAEGLKFYLPRR